MRLFRVFGALALCLAATGCSIPGQAPPPHLMVADEGKYQKLLLDSNSITKRADGKIDVQMKAVESPDSPRNTQLLAYGLPKITETIWFVQFDCQDHTFTSSAQSSVVTTTQVSLLGSTVLPGRYGIATRQPKKS